MTITFTGGLAGVNIGAMEVSTMVLTGGSSPSVTPSTVIDAGLRKTISGSAINVSAGSTLQLTGIVAGSNDLVKLGGGTLELGGAIANSFVGTPRIKSGTLFLNKTAGIDALGTAGQVIQIGDDQVGNTATLKFGAANQMVNPALNSLLVASNGTVDMSGTGSRDQAIANITLVAGPAGGSVVNLGSAGARIGWRRERSRAGRRERHGADDYRWNTRTQHIQQLNRSDAAVPCYRRGDR